MTCLLAYVAAAVALSAALVAARAWHTRGRP